MKRPAIYILIYFLIGIIYCLYFSAQFSINIFVFAVSILTLVIIIRFKNPIYIILILFTILGYYTIINANTVTNTNIDKIADTSEKPEIEAVVDNKIKVYDDTVKYKIVTNKLVFGGNIYFKKINMYLYTSSDINIGNVIKFSDKLRYANSKRNTSDFNEKNYFKAKGIEYKIYADNVEVISNVTSLKYNIYKFSDKVKNLISKIYSKEDAQFVTAMLLGDKSDLDSDIYDMYRQAGIVHIIAISGLHISILAGILLYILRPFGRYFSSFIVILFLGFYCILTGGSVSVIRATVMMLFLILSGLISRRYDILSSTALACLILLCYNPYYIYDLGFQYSFISVFSIGFILDIIKKYKINNKFLSAFLISLVVSIATKPITIYNFYYINCVDVFTNIIVIFLMQLIIPLILLSVLFGAIYLNLGIIFGSMVSFLLKIINILSNITINIPLSYISTGGITIFTLLLIYLIIILIYNIFMGKKYVIPIAVISVSILIYGFTTQYKGFEADFMYVGQGDCTILRDKDKCYMVDCGSTSYKEYGQSILKELQYNNIKKIDGIYISHLDYDHMGGVIEIADSIPIYNIYLGENYIENENYDLLIKAAKNNNININYINTNYTENIMSNTNMSLVYMDKNTDKTNESSTVLRLTNGNKSILFTGDITSTMCNTIANNYNIKSDILKVPHHGSKNSISSSFIKAVAPKIAVNFAGYNNVYMHPDTETLDMYNKNNIPFYSTNNDGMIKIRINDDNIYLGMPNKSFENINNIKG